MPFESDDTTTVNITLASGAPVVVAGPNITVNTSSVGSIEISGSSFWASNVTNNIFTTGSIDVTGSVTARLGFSGSLTTLADGSSYLIAGPGIVINSSSNGAVSISSASDLEPTYWTSTVANIIETTGSVVLSSGNLVATGSITATTGFTGSLFGTASYASNSLTASYVLQAVSSSYASTASYVVSALTASYLVDTGFSGSLTRLKDGTPYLLAGPNITIVTSSNGSIQISSSQADLDPAYWISNVAGNIFTTGSVDITGSLVASGSIQSITGFTGSLLGTASYATQAATASYVLQAVSASYAYTASLAGIATSSLNANTASYLIDTGFSGSLTRLKDGTPYLLAGTNITITTNSNGAIAISSSQADLDVNYWISNVAGNIFATGSVDITGSLYSSGSIGTLTGFTGSLLGTASYATQATTASYVLQAVSASFATNALTASYVLQAVSSSYASYAVTASQAGVATNALNANTASYVLQAVSASYASYAVTASQAGVATNALNANTASYVLQAVSASYASYAVTASQAGVATNALNANTASYVLQAVSASYASYAVTASQAGVATNALNANTASYVLQAVSSSFATSTLTASYLIDTGFSGSLTRLKDGTPYLLAGPNITITTSSNGSIQISGSQTDIDPIYWTSNIAGNIFTTGSVDITGSLVASGSIKSITGFTGSLLGTASYATQAATASYVLQAVSASYAYTASLAGIATSSLNANTASYLIDTGFSGSLTRLKDGTPYLLAGPNITITTSSNGSIQISGSQTDIDPIYWTSNVVGNIFTTGSVDITGSLVASGSIRSLTGFTGSLLGTASYATQANTASYVLQAVSASFATSALTASYVLQAVSSSYASYAVTASQAGVATNALNANTASYVLQAVSASYASYALTASQAGVATNALNANTASYLVDTGFSGSLTKLKDGTNYLIAGPNVTITTNSNGSIAISSSQADLDPTYWTSNVTSYIFTTGSVDITGSLVVSGSIRALTGFTGSLLGTASYATQAATASYVLQAISASYASYALTASQAGVATNALNANTASYVLQAVSASYASYALTASQAGVATNALNANTASYLIDTGFSGSITKLKDGTSYLLAGPNITITTNSNGSVAISASLAGVTNYWQSNVAANIFTTGSVDITGSLVASGSIRALTGFTGSLLGTASYATQAATASYVLQAVSASYASTASYVVSALTASYLVDTGFSGSLTRLKDGTPYLLAGPNITLNTASNGAISISGSGVYAPNIGWTTAFEIDFATFPSQNLTGSAGTIFNGIQFEFSNSGNANWVGPSASLGFAINSKATSTELLDSVRTAPLVNIILTNLIGDYHPDDFDVRVWAQVTHNATNSAENYFLGFERVPATATYERMHIIRGYDTAQSTNMAVCYNNITANSTKITSSIELADNTQVVSLDKWTSATHYQTSGTLGTFPASSSLKLLQYTQMGLYSDTRYTTLPMTGSNVSVMFGAQTGNTSGTYSVVFRNLRVEYRKRGGGTYVTGSFVYNYGGGGYWTNPVLDLINTTGSVSLTNGNLTVTGSVGATLGFVGNLTGTASYAAQAATASYVLQAVSASYASTASYVVSALTASYLVDTGFSGSLTRLKDGTRYLVAGPNITINTASNGSIEISGSQASYWTSNVAANVFTTGSVDITGSLVASGSIRALTGFTGSLLGTASYATQAATASYVLQAVSASYAYTASLAGIATSSLNANTASYLVDTGFSGSLTRLKDGTRYLVAGPNVTINTASNGSIEISGSQASYWTSNVAGNIFTTGSAVIYNGLTITGSLVQGSDNVASGIYSHAEGWFTTASAPYSHAEGYGSSVSISTATGSHVEGYLTIASAQMAHAEGRATTAEGHYSHAEGYNTITIGQSSHVEGYLTITYGSGSHAEGSGSIAYGNYSHAEGIETIASGSGQLTIGKYNKRANDYSLFVIGDGTGSLDNQRHDFVLVNSGSTPGAGTVIVSGSVVSTLGFTGSLFGTASYASTASYVVSALTASYLVDTGFSGSITKLKDGTPYLLAGPNITITTSSNGSIQISGSQADIDPIYWTSNVAGNVFNTGSVDITGSLVASGSIRALTGFTGSLLGTASYASQAATASYVLQAVSASYAATASYVLQAVSASYASYAVTASQAGVATNALNANTASYLVDTGFSGSITKLKDGSNYLLAGPNITITTSSNGAIQISGSYTDVDPIYWTSNIVGNVFNTGSVDITGSLVASGSIRTLTGFTGSLLGTASYATQAATASYVLQAVSASYAYTASLAGIATSSLNANTASYLVDTGFSGSLTRLKDGTLYLLAGPNITITTNSNGSVAVSGSAAVITPSYWASNIAGNIYSTGSVDITGSLVVSGSIRSLTGFTGSLLGTASFATQASTASYVLQAVSSSYASYAVTASQAGVATNALNANTASYLVDTGFSGSITKLKDGTSYLLAGPNVTITTNSNGAVAISASLAGATNYWQSSIAGNVFTTGSVDITGSLYSSGSIRSLTGFTGSLLGTASYASQAATASYVLQAVSSSYAYTASLAGIATSSLNANTASYLVDTGFSGSLTRLKDGTLYLVAGPNITITTNSNGSVAVSGSASAISTNYWFSNTAGNIFSTGSVDITGSLYSSGSITSRTGFTGSLLGTASYATQAATASYVLQAVSASYAFTASLAGIATSSLNANTASYLIDTGFSGSLTRLKDGTLYLLAGPNVTITTNSNGSVAISGSASAPTPSYWISNVSANIFATGSVDITGSLVVSGSIKALTGFSGSHTKLTDGTSYLIAGPNITITTNSNGAVAITGSAGTSSPSYWTSNTTGNIFTTGSVDITGSLVVSGSIKALTGFSGSHTKLTDGSNYLLAGPNITITTSSNGSIQISGSQPDADLIYWVSNVASNIFTTGSVDITGSLYSSGSITSRTGFTGSLLGTASYATQAATASYVLQAVSASYAYTASLAGIATSSLNANTASYLIDTGFSGSLTRLKDGTPYLLAGPNITITTSSNGSIQISGSQIDLDPIYWVSNVSGNIFTTGSVDITGSLVASGSIKALTGFSGSHTKLADGTSYLIAGTNITISSASNGAVTIAGATLPSTYWQSNIAGNIFTTGSVDITGSLVSSGSIKSITGFTGSLLGTASYASQAATASYVLQAVSASYAYTASLAGIATSSLNANTASYLVDTGFSGSLTRLKDGTLYLLAGPNVTITTNSNGSVAISGSASVTTPSYWISNVSANIFATGSVDITGSLVVSGSVKALTGFSGSHTKLTDGTSYLIAGPNITITTNSNGAVAITGSAGSSSPSYWTSNTTGNIFTTGSVDITGSLVASGSIKALTGFSGSHTKLADGTSYLIAGTSITITTGSSGAVTIASTAGPGGTVNTGSTSLDFGSAPGTNLVSASIIGQTSIVAGSQINAWMMASTTVTHNMTEHLLAPIVVKCGPATAGSGFIIYAYSEIRMTGVFKVQWFWN